MIRRFTALRASAAMPLFVLMAGLSQPAAASLKLTDSFRIGSGGVLCTAQSRIADPALSGMFDRGYRIVCRDAATPVGKLYALPAPQPVIQRHLPASRPAASIRPTRSPKAMSATTAAALPKRQNFSTCWSNATGRAAPASPAALNISPTRRCSNQIWVILPRPTCCSIVRVPCSILPISLSSGSIAISGPCTN